MTELLIICLAFLAAILVLLLLPLWKQDRKTAIIAAMLVTIVAGAMYAVMGSPRVVPLVKNYHAEMTALDTTIATASGLIKANPKNLEAWLTLGQALMDQGKYAGATQALREAVLLSGGHPRIIMGYAEAQILAADGKVTEDAKKSIDMALKLNKELAIARYYNAVWLLQNDQQKQAMEEMKLLYQSLPDSDPLKQRMKDQIGRE